MSYRTGAERFYDLFGEKADIDFYVSIALRQGGKPLNSASQPGVSTATLACDFRLWDASLEAGERYTHDACGVGEAERVHSHVFYVRAVVCLGTKNEERLPALFGLSLNEDCL